MANITLQVFRQYGFTPNFKPGKTEALVYFYRPGARVHKHLLFNVHDRKVSVGDGDATFDVHVTDLYKHLGTGFLSSPSIAPVIKQRFASVVLTTRALRRALFVSKTVTHRPATIATYLHMYLFSKAMFDCGTWPRLSITESKTIHSHVMRLYRSFISCSYDMPDIIFLQDHSLIPPCAMVSLSRLMLFSRLLVFGKFHILSILHAASARHKAWLNAVWEDLQFLTTADKFIDCKTWNMSQWVA